MRRLSSALARIDGHQRDHPWLGFPLAVVRKYRDDRASRLGALIAHFGFLSLFPLLLLFVTVLDWVVIGHPELQRRLLDSVLTQLPLIGPELRDGVQTISARGLALAAGITLALWGALGVARCAQDAFAVVWAVPRHGLPNRLHLAARGIGFLLAVGAGTVSGAAVTALSRTADTRGVLRVLFPLALFLAGVGVSSGLTLLAFRALTPVRVATADLARGALVAGTAFQTLQLIGGAYVGRLVDSRSSAGSFALVLGLLAWLHLQGQALLLAAEVSVVHARRLWPRAFASTALTDGDRRAYRSYVEAQTFVPTQKVDVHFD